MKTHKFPSITIKLGIVLLLGTAALRLSHAQEASPANPPIKLVFIGDSITAGSGTKDHQHSSYPAQLAQMLGPGWKVTNLGVSSTTLLHDGDVPYIKKPQYQQALAIKPDVLVIDLGGNDAKPQNFEQHPDDFVPDYLAMVAAFREINPNIKIYATYPVPAFPENYGIRESVIEQKIIPAAKEAVAEAHISVIDLHTGMLDKGAEFADRVHPNEAGAKALAEIVFRQLKSDFPSQISAPAP